VDTRWWQLHPALCRNWVFTTLCALYSNILCPFLSFVPTIFSLSMPLSSLMMWSSGFAQTTPALNTGVLPGSENQMVSGSKTGRWPFWPTLPLASATPLQHLWAARHTHRRAHARTHTLKHTLTRMHSHACARACAHTYKHRRAHTHTHIHMHTHKHTGTRARTHTHAQTHRHTHAHTQTHTHTQVCTHTRAHTHTRTHAHTHAYVRSPRVRDGLRQFFSVASVAPTLF